MIKTTIWLCFSSAVVCFCLICTSISQAQQADRASAFKKVLERFDTDGDGRLSESERKALRERIGSRRRATAETQVEDQVAPKAGLDMLYKVAAGPHQIDAVGELVLRDEQRDKDLQLRVSFPARGGPFPVLVWSHGATGTKDVYQPIVRHWVSHGYVCVQANHSDSRALGGRSGPATFLDWASRPKDVAFVLDSLDAIEAKAAGLKGNMDKQTIGVGGHSFGAHTAQLVAGTTTKDFGGKHTSHADPRPKAFVLISPQGKGPQLDEESWKPVTRPAIIITGSNDLGRNGQPVEWRLDPFKYAPPKDKYLLSIQGAYHGFGGITGPIRYRSAGPDNPNHLAYIKSTTTAFWDAYLKQDATAQSFLRSNKIHELSESEARLTWKGGE